LSAQSHENNRRAVVEASGAVLSNLENTQPCAGVGVYPRPTPDTNYLAQTDGTRTRSEGV